MNTVSHTQFKEFTAKHAKINEAICMTGHFNPAIVNSTIKILEEKMTCLNKSRTTISKTKLLGIEMLENMFKHQSKNNNETTFFSIGLSEKIVEIVTGNVVSKREILELDERLKELEGLSIEEINQKYMIQLGQGVLSPEGNAGLGLITIFKRSNKNVSRKMFPLNDENVYFCLTVTIENN